LLAGVDVGRVGFTARARPAIQPVRVVVQGGHVVIPVRPGDRLATACRGAVVAIQADSTSLDSGTAWSVEVVGTARVVTDPGEVAALDRLDLQTWTAPKDRCYVTVDMGVITGWRSPVTPPACGPSMGRRWGDRKASA
jgi:hypothetical protein